MGKKRYLLIFLFMLICVLSCPVIVFATDSNLRDSNSSQEIKYSSDYGYNILDEKSKEIYDKLKEACEDVYTDMYGDKLLNIKVTAGDSVLSQQEMEKIRYCFLMDNPQYFWITDKKLVTKDFIILLCDNRFSEKSVRNEMWNQIKTTIDNYITDFNNANLESDYEKQKFIHDIIITNTTPCKTSYKKTSYKPDESYKSTIEGVFGEYKTADSIGYGKAFSLLMNATGQKCIYTQYFCMGNYMVSGVCATYIEDSWYWTDVYRDDIETAESTEFLGFSNITFNQQYIRGGMIAQLPIISDTKYVSMTAQKPVFIKNLSDSLKVNTGEDFTLEVNLENNDNVSFEWYKDGEIIEGENTQSITIENASNEDSGVYKVCAICSVGENVESECSIECMVSVITPLKIVSDLVSSVVIDEGEDVILSVLAQGEGDLIYQWFKDNRLIENQSDGILWIENASTEDIGNYYVRITDSELNTIISSVSQLYVISRPEEFNFGNIEQPIEEEEREYDNLTVPVIKLQDTNAVYEKIDSNNNEVIKCADIYYNAEKSKVAKATVEIDTSNIDTEYINSSSKFKSELIEILKSIASLNIDKPTQSFQLFEKRFTTDDDDYMVMTFSKHLEFAFPVKVTFTVDNNDFNNDDCYLYYFNDEEKILELYQDNLNFNNNAFIVNLSHCSEYVISQGEITVSDFSELFDNQNSEKDNSNKENPKTSVNTMVPTLLILILTLLYILVKSKKLNKF